MDPINLCHVFLEFRPRQSIQRSMHVRVHHSPGQHQIRTEMVRLGCHVIASVFKYYHDMHCCIQSTHTRGIRVEQQSTGSKFFFSRRLDFFLAFPFTGCCFIVYIYRVSNRENFEFSISITTKHTTIHHPCTQQMLCRTVIKWDTNKRLTNKLQRLLCKASKVTLL